LAELTTHESWAMMVVVVAAAATKRREPYRTML